MLMNYMDAKIYYFFNLLVRKVKAERKAAGKSTKLVYAIKENENEIYIFL